MTITTLEDKINSIGNPADMLRNAQAGPYQFPIKAEFTNWRDEQEAWRHGAVLFDQSYHMTDHYIEGPDVKTLLEDLAINSMANFRKDIAKQVVFCNHDGYMIGDAVRDKDAVAAACLICEMAHAAQREGIDMLGRLERIHRTHGAYLESLVSQTKQGRAGKEEIAQQMAYCLRHMEVVDVCGKTGNALNYEFIRDLKGDEKKAK